jgi:hypothetical protein
VTVLLQNEDSRAFVISRIVLNDYCFSNRANKVADDYIISSEFVITMS